MTTIHSDVIVLLVTTTGAILCQLLTQTVQQRYRITLDLSVEDDFNPRDINWDKVFDLGGNESVESYIEELDLPVNW